MTKSLLALAIGGFGIGLTEFVVMGLLPDVATDLGVTIPRAGDMITAYALGVVVGAPTLTSLAGKWSPTKTLMALMAMFTLFNGLSGLMPNHVFLLISRFLSGLPHGAFFGIGAVVASRLSPGKEGKAVSIMLGGLTIATVFGVPAGTWIGHHFGWRLTFGLVALIGIAAFLSIRAWIPVLPSKPDSSLRQDLKILQSPTMWLAILVPSIGFSGFFAWISYIAPLFTEEAGFSPATIPLLMIVAGVGMTCGNFIGGALADRYAPVKTVIVLMILLSGCLGLNYVFSSTPAVLIPLTFLTGALAMALGSPIQLILMANSKGAEMFGASLGQSSFNIGNGLGAALGGIPLTMGYSYASPQLVGVMMSLCGAGLATWLYFAQRGSPIRLQSDLGWSGH